MLRPSLALAACLVFVACSSEQDEVGEDDASEATPPDDDTELAAVDARTPTTSAADAGTTRPETGVEVRSDAALVAAPGATDAAVFEAVGDAAATAGGSITDAGTSALPTRLTIHLAGDSTVSTYKDTASEHDQAGWGQMLGALFGEGVSVDNHAIGGRTARRFVDEQRLDELLNVTAPGDYVFVQFGTNDGHRSATYEIDGKTYPYYADPQTDFRAALIVYLDRVAARGAIPVLVTPPPRNSAYCTGGNGTSAHAEAMRGLGKDRGVPVLDLNARSVSYLKAICPAPQPEDFFLLRPDGSVDGTHFQEHGARVLASLVAKAIVDANLPLASGLRQGAR